MLAQWTGDIVGKMHIYGISVKELADRAGWSAQYLSTVLHCKKSPQYAKEKLSGVMNEIISERKERYPEDEISDYS